jgi:hypothetical protein
MNDAIVFAVMGVSSAAAGLLVTDQGWRMVNYASLPFLLLVSAAIVALRLSQRRSWLCACRSGDCGFALVAAAIVARRVSRKPLRLRAAHAPCQRAAPYDPPHDQRA